MPLPSPMSFSQFTDNYMANWAIVVNVPNIQSIPASDPAWGLAQANSGAALYLQGLIYQLLSFSNGSTATGTDLDSWWAQFGFKRPQGSPATISLQVVVSAPCLIPAGAIIQTQPLTIAPATTPQVFQCATVQAYNFTTPGTYNITAQAVGPITTGNVTGYSIFNNIGTGLFTQFFSPISGITSVTNPTSPVFGTDNASDSQGRTDFIDYITSLSEATLAALVAAVQDTSAGFVYQQTFNLLDFQLAPSNAQPGQIVGVFIGPGSGQYPGSNPDNLAMDNALLALQTSCAFGLTPLEYYANQYAVTAIAFTYTYSRSQLTASGLSVQGLQNLMTSTLQGFFPASGDNLGVAVAFSQIARALLNIQVVLANATVSNIVTDVNVTTLSITTSPGGTFTTDLVQPGTPSTLDQLGYLSMATSINPVYTATPPAP